jgi:hypothetical protein
MAFAIFFFCVMAQFYLGRQFRRVLVERHPEVWAEISRRSIFIDSATLSFATSRRCKDLADPELSRAASRIKWVSAVAIGSWLVLVASMFLARPE